MLLVKDSSSPSEHHSFSLSSIEIDTEISYQLRSDTYEEAEIKFTLKYPKSKIFSEYSVSVYLFKNKHFSQKDIIDLRVNEIGPNSGRIGYFIRLDALFENEILQLNQHIYPYVYYALEYIFSSTETIQTKEYELTSNPPNITDFFDEDTIVLVLCNEYVSFNPKLKILDYLAPLYLHGFTWLECQTKIERFNNTEIISDNFDTVKQIVRPDGTYVLRINSPIDLLLGENFITHLFKHL